MASIRVRGRIPIEKVGSPMPPAGPDYEGKTTIHRVNNKTEVLLCVQNSGGDYEWIEIGEST